MGIGDEFKLGLRSNLLQNRNAVEAYAYAYAYAARRHVVERGRNMFYEILS